MQCRAQRTGHHKLFIHESPMKEFIDFLELRAHLLVDVGLLQVAEKILVKVHQQLLSMLPHSRSLATKPKQMPNCVSN